VQTRYVYNGFPYLGKDELRTEDSLFGEYVVRKLAEPIFFKGYCIITDNYFTSVKISKEFFENKTTLIGTMKRNRRELPFFAHSNQKTFESRFFENSATTITVYQAKPKKMIILSSEHEQLKVPEAEQIEGKKRKPNTILDYNKKKLC
jgi:hypothetical protein